MTEFAAIERNLRECFRALAARRENAEIRLARGIELISLNVRFQMFNAAFLVSPVGSENELDRRIAEAAVHFGARGIEWSFWLCDGFLAEEVKRKADKLFQRRGLSMATRMPGMAARRLPEAVRALPRCSIREVADSSTLEHFREIGSQCFRVPVEWFEEVFDGKTFLRAPFRAWVGYAGGRQVGTVATVTDEDAVGLYNVATLPEFRSRGYAEAMMREALAAVDGGAMPLVLQSTAQGLALYEQMGFHAETLFRVWVS